LDGQGRIEANGPVIKDDDEVEELREAVEHGADQLNPGNIQTSFYRFSSYMLCLNQKVGCLVVNELGKP
jgi:hypothetical protein